MKRKCDACGEALDQVFCEICRDRLDDMYVVYPFYFTVPGPPVAKARARKGIWGYYTPKETVEYEKLVATIAKRGWGNQPTLLGPIRIVAHFFMPIPKSWSKKKKEKALSGDIRPVGRPDIDNLLKSQCDPLQVPTPKEKSMGIIKASIFKNDSQIVETECEQHYSNDPRVEIWISEI